MEMGRPIAVRIRHLGQTREMQMAVQRCKRSQRWHLPTVPLPHQLRRHRRLRPRKLQLSNQAIPRSGRVPMPRRFNLHLRQQKLPARARQLPNPRNILFRHQRLVSCTCFILAWFERLILYIGCMMLNQIKCILEPSIEFLEETTR